MLQRDRGSQDAETFDAAIRYLRQGWDAQAFSLLASTAAEQFPAPQFALALCYLRAGAPEKALSCLERTLRLIREGPLAPPGAAENSDTHARLYAGQIENRAWLNPMDADFCERFPRAAEQTALLALIHVHTLLGQADKAKSLAAGLTGRAFEEYKRKLFENTKGS